MAAHGPCWVVRAAELAHLLTHWPAVAGCVPQDQPSPNAPKHRSHLLWLVVNIPSVDVSAMQHPGGWSET